LRIEQLPKWLLCIPLLLQWLWLGVRWRSLTLPSAANPGIATGGLAGESKGECLAQIAARFHSNIAGWRVVAPGSDARAVRSEAGWAYPVIAKPDIGWCGYGVRQVADDAALAAYQAAFPPDAAFMVQAYVPGPCEACLFYLRWPGARHGKILAITLRHAPFVVGDGLRNVGALLAIPRLSRYLPMQTAATLAYVPPNGAKFVVSTIASIRAGARYEDVSALGTARLCARLDAMARSMGAFHVGRFDVRCASVAALRQGRFSVIEVNGAGSEAIHLWDPALPIAAAFKGVFAKQAMLFRLGDAMRRRGHRPVGVIALARAWLRQQRLIGRYPANN